jgi:iron complex outermembrane receptor protein
LVYAPNENLSVFATYTNSFASNAGYTSDQFGTVNTNQSVTANSKSASYFIKTKHKPINS